MNAKTEKLTLLTEAILTELAPQGWGQAEMQSQQENIP